MIYIVEDEENIRELVAYTLQNTGFDARGFANGHDFLDAVRERAPDLALLDIMLPGDDGLAVLTQLRASPGAGKTPVMMLTARSSEYDKVLGFNTGADDYLTKPFGMMELVARVKNLLRRAGDTAGSGEYKMDGLSVSVPRHSVAVFGDAVALTLKEFNLLECLLKNAGKVMTRDVLLSDVWGYDFEGETRTVDTHILTLRSKLGRCGALIQTVRGVGYKIGDGK
ncbi:MAG: response regulator transcription factor [Oscillospiraceae bacterium]|jgi:two-component system alkaline phosphatase synthesis response regulator PhoP|nr:response regulator transcription factor [Oscillospiraceae bacterium]